MSARFGRNQRRKLSAEVDRHAAEARRLEAVAGEYHANAMRHLAARQETEGELIEWAARIVALLGEDSAFARKMGIRQVDQAVAVSVMRDGEPMRAYPQAAPPPIIHPDHPDRRPTLAISRDVIDTFATWASADRDDIAYRIRFLIRDPRGNAAMMMDDRTRSLLMQRGDPALVRFLIDQLVGPWLKGKL